MATTVGQHGVTAFTNPSNGDALDATVVKGNDNTLREAYVDHDSDPGIHVQSSAVALRPAAGSTGRKWMTYDGTSPRLWYDDGTAWREISYLSTSPGATTFTGTVTVASPGTGFVGVNASLSGQVSAPNASFTQQLLAYAGSGSPAQTFTQLLGFENQTTATDWTGSVTQQMRPVRHIRLTGNATVTLSNTVAYITPASAFSLFLIKQDGVGGRTLAFTNVLFPGGTTPTQTSTANKADLWLFVALDNTTFYGVRLGANL